MIDYCKEIFKGLKSLLIGMGITIKYCLKPVVPCITLMNQLKKPERYTEWAHRTGAGTRKPVKPNAIVLLPVPQRPVLPMHHRWMREKRMRQNKV
jgi:hypothetical protein